MSKPALLQNVFSQGMVRDKPKDQLPKGAVWTMDDFIPDELGAPLVSRSGWSYAAAAFGTSKVTMSALAPFASGMQLCAATTDGHLYTITMPADSGGVSQLGTVTDKGAATWYTADYCTWAFHRDTLFGFPKAGGAAVFKYTGTGAPATVAAIPQAATGCVYKDRLWSGYTAANPNRIWWSDAGDPLTWTTGAGGWWVDADQPIEALASPGNVIMVFHQNRVSRIRGAPGMDDFVLEGLFDFGVLDKRSIVNWGAYVLWADMTGIYMSDGVSYLDLTEDKINDYYRSVVKTATDVVGFVYRDHYVLSVYGTTNVAFVYDMSLKRWWTFSNLKLNCATSWPSGWTQPQTQGSLVDAERCYAGLANTNRLVRLDDMWIESKTTTDADGTAVLGSVRLPYYRSSLAGEKRYRFVYCQYRTSGTLSLSSYSVEGTETVLGTLPAASTEMVRKRLPVNKGAYGAQLNCEMASAGHTHLYGFEVDAWGEEQNR